MVNKPKLPKGFILWVGNENKFIGPKNATLVDVYLRHVPCPVLNMQAYDLMWDNENMPGDIIAYRKVS